MTDTKICTYQSCRDVFERPARLSKAQWDQISRCPKCRARVHRNKPRNRPSECNKPETRLGRYEVKSDIIDKFLYANGRH